MAKSHLNDDEQAILNDIEDYGWHSVGVFDPDSDWPNFLYSVGFTQTLNAPEFIVYGLPHDVMHHMLWEVFRQIQNGADVKDGSEWPELLSGDYICISKNVPNDQIEEAEITSANWYWRHQGRTGAAPLCQLVWPATKTFHYPWQKDCPADVIQAQPLLFEPPHA